MGFDLVWGDRIGDTHGQFFDFIHLLELTGRPAENHTLLFNGDFVDRGSWSTEIVLVLFAYKCTFRRPPFGRRGADGVCVRFGRVVPDQGLLE